MFQLNPYSCVNLSKIIPRNVSRDYIVKKVIVLVILCKIIMLNHIRLPCTVSCVGKGLKEGGGRRDC